MTETREEKDRERKQIPEILRSNGITQHSLAAHEPDFELRTEHGFVRYTLPQAGTSMVEVLSLNGLPRVVTAAQLAEFKRTHAGLYAALDAVDARVYVRDARGQVRSTILE
jgi:hypothetical protein